MQQPAKDFWCYEFGVQGTMSGDMTLTTEPTESAWLMLFFDLLFVGVLSKLSEGVDQAIEGGFSMEREASSFSITFLILLSFLCLWLDMQLFAANVRIISIIDLVLLMLNMASILAMSFSLRMEDEDSHTADGWPVFLYALFFSRLFSLLQWGLVCRAQESHQLLQCQKLVKLK